MVGGASKQQTIPDFERTEAAPVTGRPAAPCCLGSTLVGSRPVARRRPSKAVSRALVLPRHPFASNGGFEETITANDPVPTCKIDPDQLAHRLAPYRSPSPRRGTL